jgi:hypothetical protein
VKEQPKGKDAVALSAAQLLERQQRASLTAVQTMSPIFNGLGEEELDAIFPFLTISEFKEGDTLVKAGEEATWVGILLYGVLAAQIMDNGRPKTVGEVAKGRALGEMALFRGGKRGADLVGKTDGTSRSRLKCSMSPRPTRHGGHSSPQARWPRFSSTISACCKWWRRALRPS